MIYSYCPNCCKMTGHKRALGWGTFFGGIFTAGISTLTIPFYPKRCIVCGRESSGKESKPQYSSTYETPEIKLPSKSVSQEKDTKKCPVCAEVVKLEAIKCRFCGETFDPADVAQQVAKVRNEDSFDNRVLCSDCACIGVIGPDGKCKVCGKLFMSDDAPTRAATPIYTKPLHKKWYQTKIGLLLILFAVVIFVSLFEEQPNFISVNSTESPQKTILPPRVNAQMDEKSKLLKSNFFGNFHQATKTKKNGKESLRIWEPQLNYIKTILPNQLPTSPDFLTISGGVEKLDIEYDEIWIYEDTEGLTPSEKEKFKGRNNLTKMYWNNNKVQACSVEKWFIGNPLTGENLPKPSHKIWNIYPRDYILKKLEEN